MKDIFSKVFRLSRERWGHIITRHPEIRSRKVNIHHALASPDIIVASSKDSVVHVYQKQDDQGYYLTVVVHSKEQFVITAFITDKIKKGTII